MGDEAQTPDLTSSLSSPFFFVQTEDGSIPSTYYSREENHEVVNIMKAIVSAFQANFKGTKTKEEADPQSLHKSEYRLVPCAWLSFTERDIVLPDKCTALRAHVPASITRNAHAHIFPRGRPTQSAVAPNARAVVPPWQ